jgi:Collagen triple helix repeat (20 copies)
MSLCASCGVDRSIGCEHFESTDFAGLQEKIIEVSEAAAGEKKVAPRSAVPVPDEAKPYVPGQRSYQAAPVQGEQRGPSVIMSHGPAGPAGATGLPGKDGKDADVAEVIDLATRTMESRLAKFEASVADLLTKTLQRAGVIDENGRAILLQGPAGRDGKDSTVPGPQGLAGARGERGLQGDRGERGEQGERGLTGATGAQGLRGEKGDPGEQGPQGERGAQGEKGTPGARGVGDISAALANCEQLIEEKFAEFRKEIRNAS